LHRRIEHQHRVARLRAAPHQLAQQRRGRRCVDGGRGRRSGACKEGAKPDPRRGGLRTRLAEHRVEQVFDAALRRLAQGGGQRALRAKQVPNQEESGGQVEQAADLALQGRGRHPVGVGRCAGVLVQPDQGNVAGHGRVAPGAGQQAQHRAGVVAAQQRNALAWAVSRRVRVGRRPSPVRRGGLSRTRGRSHKLVGAQPRERHDVGQSGQQRPVHVVLPGEQKV
jgi:hypothetical protein